MKTSEGPRWSRRAFLRATGIGVGFLPLLGSDLEAMAAAPRRCVLIAWPNGVRSGDWWPDAKPGSIEYTEADAARAAIESNFTLVGRKMIEPLEPHRQDLLLFLGVQLTTRVPGGHESQPHLFTLSGGNTLDQHVGMKQSTPFKTLNFAVQKRDQRGHIYRNGQGVTLEEDPYKVFDTVLGGRSIDPAVFEKQRATRRSILDHVNRELQEFATIVGKEDRARIDHHLTSLREVEKRLSAPVMTAPGGRPASLSGNKFDPRNVSNFHLATRAYMDIIVLALATDATRAITLLLADGNGSDLATPWLGPEFALNVGEKYLGIQNSHHTHSHKEDEMHMKMQRWFCGEFAYLIEKMKQTPDPTGGRLLDSSVVLVINNMMTGGGHRTTNLPIFMAGSGGGYFKTGRYIRTGGGVKLPGPNHNGILSAVANAMGVPSPIPELPGLRG